MEDSREASPPPLLAYTASQQAKNKRPSLGRQKNVPSKRATYRPRKKEEPIVFDEAARREFLTGFRKRKQARIEKSRERAKEREKEERRKMREDTRKARKEQAEENVRQEKAAYGGGSESTSGSENGEDDRPSPSAFETEEHHTTVTVETWDPKAEDDKEKQAAKSKAATRGYAALPPSSRRASKKLKNLSQNKKASSSSANDISRLIEDEGRIGSTFDLDSEVKHVQANGKSSKAPNDAKKKFKYESKLERAQAKAALRESRVKFAEKRKEAAMAHGHQQRGGKSKKGHRRK